MTERNTGGPAFPSGAVHKTRPAHDPGGDFRVMSTTAPAHAGMTLRDHFAAKAMQGLCADPSNHKLFRDHVDAATNAYLIADAMLEVRNG